MRTLRRAVKFGFSALLLLMCFWLTGCQLSGTFSVSKRPGGAGLGMEYERLNGRKTAELGLSEGDRVRVSLLHTAGQVDVVLCREGDEPVYRGTGQENAEFTVTIPRSGIYQVTVTGHLATGKVLFIRLGEELGGR